MSTDQLAKISRLVYMQKFSQLIGKRLFEDILLENGQTEKLTNSCPGTRKLHLTLIMLSGKRNNIRNNFNILDTDSTFT